MYVRESECSFAQDTERFSFVLLLLLLKMDQVKLLACEHFSHMSADPRTVDARKLTMLSHYHKTRTRPFRAALLGIR
jgi:hypothetical protein